MANYTKLKVIWKNNLNNIYKDNTIIGVGQEAIINIDEKSIAVIYVNFKVNDEVFTDLVEINGNIINVPFKTDVLKVGTHKLEIVAYLKNNDVVPSPTFTYYVEESLANPNDVTAETYYPILIELLEKIDEWNEGAVANENERIANENERIANENERIEYEDVRRSEEIERVGNETLRKSAEIQRIDEETQRLTKEEERLIDEQIRQNAERIREANEEERIRKEIERQNAEELRQIAYNSSLYSRMDEAEDRLNEVNSQLAHKVNKTEFDEETKFNAYFMGINPQNEDNTDSLERALELGNKNIFIPYSDNEYNFRRDVVLPTGTKLFSNGAIIKGGFIVNEADNVTIEGLVFNNRNEGSNEVAIKILNSSDITIKDCTFESKTLYASSKGNKNLRILNNSFKGEYRNTSEINVVQIEGYENVIVSENIMNCNTPLRFFKITSTENDGNNPAVVTRPTKNINIINNIIKGSCVKQMIDCYSGVDGFIFKGNQIEVYDCTSVLEGKCDGGNEGGSGITSYTSKQNKIIVSNNVIVSNPTNFIIMFQGAYGLDFEDEQQRINISNNTIENTLDANTSLIDLRGFHSITISNNSLNKLDRTGKTDFSYSITVNSSKNVNILGNNITNGCIRISEILKTTTSLNYSKPIQNLKICENIIDNVCSFGGIYFETMTNTDNPCYLVSNNIIRSLRYQSPESYAVYFSDTCVFSEITFLGNMTRFPNNSAREKIRVGSATCSIISKNNTWNDSE